MADCLDNRRTDASGGVAARVVEAGRTSGPAALPGFGLGSQLRVGRRPGAETAKYIDYVLTRITAVGAIYLAAVCILPEVLTV